MFKKRPCAGFVPAPMLFGVVIDSTCRLWQRADRCGGGGGSCLLFDSDQLRWRIYGVVLAIQLVQLTLRLLFYCRVRGRRFADDEEDALSSVDKRPGSPSSLPADDGNSPPPTFDELNLAETNDDQVTVVRM